MNDGFFNDIFGKLYIITYQKFMIRCPLDRLLVTIDKKYQDKQGNLFIDTTFQPEEYATLKGTVVSVPDRVTEEYWKGSIDQLARVGDEIWFSYGVVFDYAVHREGETPIYKNLIVFEGEEYWSVRYEEAFCIVRDGKILVPTQHVLMIPVEKDAQPTGGLISLIKSTVHEDRAMVLAMPEMEINCQPGDIVAIEMDFVQKYIMFDKPHYIIPTRRLIAKY